MGKVISFAAPLNPMDSDPDSIHMIGRVELRKGKLIIRLASPDRNLNAKCCSLKIFFYFPQIKKENALHFVCTFTFRKWI